MNENIIYLATSSVSRKELVKNNNLNWILVNNKFDEESYKSKFKVNTLQQAINYTKFLSDGKAKSVANELSGYVIGCDSVAFVKGKILEKPKNTNEFEEMMKVITTYPHYLITGVTIINTKNFKSKTFADITKLYFDSFSDEQKDILLNKYNGLNNAGGYTLCPEIEKNTHIIKGSRDNVIGIPIKKILKEINNL